MGKTDLLLPVLAVAAAACVLGFALAADMGLMGAAAAAILLAMFALDRNMRARRQSLALSALRRERDVRCIQAISRLRHDWMNDIQLLTSYVKLGKLDKSKETAETIREKAMRESRLFRIGSPGLVLALYSLPVEYPHVKLGWNISPDFSLDISHELEERLTSFVEQAVQGFAEEAERSAEKCVLLDMSMEGDREAVLAMTLAGDGMNREAAERLAGRIRRIAHRQGCRQLACETESDETCARVTLRIRQNGGQATEV